MDIDDIRRAAMNELKQISDELIADEHAAKIAEVETATKALAAAYKTMVACGFTEDQAMKLLCAIVSGKN